MSYVNAGLEQLVVVVQHANSASQRKGQMLTDKKIANAVASLRARLARTVGYNEGKSRANATKHVDACAKTKRRKYFILVLTRISCVERVILKDGPRAAVKNTTPCGTTSQRWSG